MGVVQPRIYTSRDGNKACNEEREIVAKPDKKKVLSVIRKCSDAFLVTVDRGQPKVRMVAPVVASDMSMWVITSFASRKVAQVKRNPRVCLHFQETGGAHAYASVMGKARIEKNVKEKKRAWNAASYDMSQWWREGPESPKYTFLRILIKEIEWCDKWAGKPNLYKPARA